MTRLAPSLPALSIRVLLAVLLMFGSEVLAWNNPTGHSALEWPLNIAAYFALSTILLDFIIRYRVRDLFGLLVLAGIYSLSAALLIFPQSAFVDMPRTLVTRVMGAHALIAAEMMGVFLAITGGLQGKAWRNVLIGCVIVGLAWGFWVKDWPVEAGYQAVSLAIMLAFGIGGIVLIGATDRYANSMSSPEISPDSLRLSIQGWGGTVILAGALLIIRLVQGQIELGALVLTTLLIVLSWGIIWFRGRTKGETLLDGRIPVRNLSLSGFLMAVVIFLAIGIFAYNLPPINVAGITPIALIGLGFTAYGLAWLPTVSLVLGARAYLRQIQTEKL